MGIRKGVLFAIGLIAVSLVAATPAAASTASDTRTISAEDTAAIAAPEAPVSMDVAQPEILDTTVGGDAAGGNGDSASDRSHTRGVGVEGNGARDSARESSDTSQVTSFDGLNHFAQRFGATNNALSVAPPDQGLCEGNGMVLESVNSVTAVYSSTGALLAGPTALNKFYGYPPAINRATGVRGPFVTDPSCYFDRATQRWFMVVLTLETFPSGRFKGPNHLDVAVSRTADPTGTWTVYRLPIQDDGTQGTPNHHCSTGPYPVVPTNPFACLGDYPHIGADANGFYITTNEYSLFGPEFKAAQIYAFSKQALAANATSVTVTQIDTTGMVRGVQSGFTVWPATGPNGDSNSAANGTENFLSSNAASEVNPLLNRTSRDLIVWSLSNTASLGTPTPDLTLTNTVLKVGRYSAPPKANQKVGNTPLADCLNDTSLQVAPGVFGCWRLAVTVEPKHNQVVQQRIDTNDTRMQQVTYAGGMVYGALDTGVKVKGRLEAGIEWFAVDVSDDGGASLTNEGFVGSAGTNLSYPALAVNADGVGVMAFSLMGDNDYPSAAWAPFDAKRGVGDIHVAGVGQGPTDGFTDYGPAFGNPPRARWGDYGAAVIDGSNVWISSEYIGQTCDFNTFIATNFRCGNTRTQAGNWDTRITELSLS
ncbi:MAG TPA: hypothetical protein VHO95_05125 [Candidatus Dormibacteraeota bacterium]|nr:hypothetical protein [Candidatus Dormibacteraeota bacterium]